MLNLDSQTVVIVAVALMLANGAVLGFLHAELTPDIQPSAADWRIGTLLMAGGCTLFAMQQFMPPGFVLPAANGAIFAGLTLYWRAVRRFDGLAESYWIYLPAALAVVGIFWFSAVTPRLAIRGIIATLLFAVVGCSAAWSLWTCSPSAQAQPWARRRRVVGFDVSVNRLVVAGVFLLVAFWFILRTIYFVIYPPGEVSLLAPLSFFVSLTFVVFSALPVIGTTAFLLLCFERLRTQAERAAATDFLTGLVNRRTIMLTGRSGFEVARRGRTPYAVAILDIDHFKSINDRFGHDVGDLALQHVAQVLHAHCRGPHLLGRLGGEEFVALLDDADRGAAQTAAERLRHALESAPLSAWPKAPTGTAPLQITISVGVGLTTAEDKNFDDLLHRADQALYAAKAGGRNRVVVA